jgi:ABC-2 type transport system permease protein
MTSTIYDLGYQTYTGERRGRAYAIRTLTAFSFRQAFGIGRGDQARRLPIVIGAVIFAPALTQIGVASATGMQSFIHYSDYLEFTSILLALFTAAQAAELLVTDKQSGAITLYLSRPVKPTDYAIAKLVALIAAVLILTLAPQILLFSGKVMLAKEVWPAFKGEAPKLVPIVVGSVLISIFFATIGLALSSFAVRRAYGSAAVIAFFLLTPALMQIVRLVATGEVRRWAVLLSPVNIVTGFSAWLFTLEASRRTIVGRADLPGQAYFWVLFGVSVASIALLLWRYRRIDA